MQLSTQCSNNSCNDIISILGTGQRELMWIVGLINLNLNKEIEFLSVSFGIGKLSLSDWSP